MPPFGTRMSLTFSLLPACASKLPLAKARATIARTSKIHLFILGSPDIMISNQLSQVQVSCLVHQPDQTGTPEKANSSVKYEGAASRTHRILWAIPSISANQNFLGGPIPGCSFPHVRELSHPNHK